MNNIYNEYIEEFKLYAATNLKAYKSQFSNSENSTLQFQSSLLVFNKNLIKFSKELNAKANQLRAAAYNSNSISFIDIQKEIFTIGKEYIREFATLYK